MTQPMPDPCCSFVRSVGAESTLAAGAPRSCPSHCSSAARRDHVAPRCSGPLRPPTRVSDSRWSMPARQPSCPEARAPTAPIAADPSPRPAAVSRSARTDARPTAGPRPAVRGWMTANVATRRGDRTHCAAISATALGRSCHAGWTGKTRSPDDNDTPALMRSEGSVVARPTTTHVNRGSAFDR